MNRTNSLFTKLVHRTSFLLLFLSAFPLLASSNQAFDLRVQQLYHSLKTNSKTSMASRLDTISARFLNKPYLLGALGEGSNARFDQTPLYRLDAFDCETFVTSMLALAFATDAASYKKCLQKLRYKNGRVNYVNRNHFTSLDWNGNNQAQGFVKDITNTFKDAKNKPVALMARAMIDKPSWYRHKTSASIKLTQPNAQKTKQRLQEMQALANTQSLQEASIPYIPLTALFDTEGNPRLNLFSQIPDAAIIEIVRPNWDLTKQIGTHLNVSHIGFAFWKNGVLIFREATSDTYKVIDIPLIDYLRKTMSSPTIKGINVQVIVPQKAFINGC